MRTFLLAASLALTSCSDAAIEAAPLDLVPAAVDAIEAWILGQGEYRICATDEIEPSALARGEAGELAEALRVSLAERILSSGDMDVGDMVLTRMDVSSDGRRAWIEIDEAPYCAGGGQTYELALVRPTVGEAFHLDTAELLVVWCR